MASIIIPAHNEEAGIARLLECLDKGIAAGDFDVYVICNGCSDRTAEIARKARSKVSVTELPEPSKARALKVGDAVAGDFPRFYVDADVVIDTASMRTLIAALASSATLAVAPQRILDRDDVSWLARWYYDVWETMPSVKHGLFGRGVIGVSESGFDRIRGLPELISDDLAMSEAFKSTERLVVEHAHVRVFPAKTWRALIHRRVRAIAGSRIVFASGLTSPTARTRPRDIARLALTVPAMTPKVVLFLLTTVIVRSLVRYRSLRGQQDVWYRDETSRRSTP